ncbi:MAG: beta-L-arabinofuranosidase domain-containing protein, partial [Chthonomonadales bacterium]
TLTGNKEALVVLGKMTDWAVKNLPRRQDEWYTLPENLYNCYALTKDARYLQMAKEYDYSKEYYDPFANGINAFTPERHAYSHVNTLTSAAKAYEFTGDEKYFKAITNAWTFLTTTQMYASGGWGADERFVKSGQGLLAGTLDKTHAHFETPCGAYANVNLDRYLLRFTGDTKYGDNMERVLYNGMLASLPMQSEGKTFYYSDYKPGTKKVYFREAWPCCSGTYAEITADYPLDIYFHDDRGLFVNLFTPSVVKWKVGKQNVSVEQATSYPESDNTTLTIHTSRPARFALHVRVPGWTAKPVKVMVNNKLESVPARAGSFLAIERIWHDGDVVKVTFPMALHYEAIAPESPDKQAMLYGPLLLVALTDKALTIKKENVQTIFSSQPDMFPKFEIDGGSTTFLPFYKVRDESYTTYFSVGR